MRERDFTDSIGGERIELNAMLPAQLLAWLEDELLICGVRKVMPEEDDVLGATWRRQRQLARVEEAVRTLLADTDREDHAPDSDLRAWLVAHLPDSHESWDALLADLARETL